MRRYRAVVIDGKKLLRRAVALATLATVAALGILNINIASPEVSVDTGKLAESVIAESLPIMGAMSDMGRQAA